MKKRQNHYQLSNGEKVAKSTIDRNVRKAKEKKLNEQFEIHYFNFCEECGRNASGTRLDCAHTISVDECQKSGRAELAWDTDNIRILCRQCHKEQDKNFIHTPK